MNCEARGNQWLIFALTGPKQMAFTIRVKLHEEFIGKMAQLAKIKPEKAVPILVRTSNISAAQCIVDEEFAIVNHKYPVVMIEISFGDTIPLGVIDTDPDDGGHPVLYIVDYIEKGYFTKFSDVELVRIASRCASIAGIIPLDVYLCN